MDDQQEQPPVSTTLTTSSPTCALNGKPPFTATTTYECTTSRPIWALIRLFTDFGGGIEIRDPQRKHRRMGPPSTIVADEWDTDALDLDDTVLVRLEPNQKFSTSYTFSVVPKASGIVHSDVRHMAKGNTYEITLRRRRWRWMFEDEMEVWVVVGEEMSEEEEEEEREERRQMLRKKEVMEWEVDCMVTFTPA